MLMLSEDLPEGQVIFRIEIAHGRHFVQRYKNSFNLNEIKIRTITTPPIMDIDFNLNTAMYIVMVKTTKQIKTNKIVLY